jgi:glucokinase
MATDRLVLGFDIGGTQVRAALGKRNQIVAQRAATWPRDRSPADEVEFVAELAFELHRQHTPDEPIQAAGVALAALVDRSGRVVHWPNKPGWRDLPFRSLLAERLGVPTVVEDDANTAALAEYTHGAGRGYRQVLVLMAGTGIGAGLILDGHLFRGRHGWAGELGHVVMQPDGPECTCGHRGCLQSLASGRALERIAAAQGLADVPALIASANNGELPARTAIITCGRWIGLATANLVNLLDLEAIVIGGGLLGLGDLWWSAIEQTLHANMLNGAYASVALHRAALPDSAGLLGALTLATQRIESG